MQNRSRDKSAHLSVADVDKLLTKLAEKFDQDGKLEVIKSLLQSMNMLELKWVTKVILRDLKLGIGHESIFKMYHKHALDIFNATSDLKAVFEQVEDYELATKGGNAQLVYRLFFPIKPMLAGKLPLPQIQELLRSKLDQHPTTPILVETKFDGERIQCHLQDLAVMFYSRGGKDYSRIYGQKLAGFIRDNVKAQAAVLDGEVIVWDTRLNKAAPFGKNKQVALADDPAKNLALSKWLFTYSFRCPYA